MPPSLLHLIPRFLAVTLGILTIPRVAGATEQDNEGFRLAAPGYRYQFPRDHGSHPAFKIEWWYLTGHLWSQDRQQRFGYQATFFRRGVRPVDESDLTSAPFGTNQIYLAHMAILDVTSKTFVYEERINRDGWDAHADETGLDVGNGNWSLKMINVEPDKETMRLAGSVRAIALFELELETVKPKVIFGQDGVSRKGSAPTAASHYVTFTRLKTTGSLHYNKQHYTVTGTTWMDHEISSSQLDANQVGWDWASIQLRDGSEIMVYALRRDDGTRDPFSTLAWIGPDGSVRQFPPTEFRWTPTDHWTSPHSGARYPIASELQFQHPITGDTVKLRLRPLAEDQELQGELGGIRYWEGACEVEGDGGESLGTAYVELTGYDGQLQQSLQ